MNSAGAAAGWADAAPAGVGALADAPPSRRSYHSLRRLFMSHGSLSLQAVEILVELVLNASEESFRLAKIEDPSYEDRLCRNTGAGWDQFETQSKYFFNILFDMDLSKADVGQKAYDLVQRNSATYQRMIVCQARNRTRPTDHPPMPPPPLPPPLPPSPPPPKPNSQIRTAYTCGLFNDTTSISCEHFLRCHQPRTCCTRRCHTWGI